MINDELGKIIDSHYENVQLRYVLNSVSNITVLFSLASFYLQFLTASVLFGAVSVASSFMIFYLNHKIHKDVKALESISKDSDIKK